MHTVSRGDLVRKICQLHGVGQQEVSAAIAEMECVIDNQYLSHFDICMVVDNGMVHLALLEALRDSEKKWLVIQFGASGFRSEQDKLLAQIAHRARRLTPSHHYQQPRTTKRPGRRT